MKNYEINEDTMAIMPVSYYETLVKEKDREFLVEKNAYEIMEESCEYYGSTINGRIKAAKKILDCPYKTPLLIEESENIIFFPTKSSKDEKCHWINNNYVSRIIKNNNKSKILFTNGEEVEIGRAHV